MPSNVESKINALTAELPKVSAVHKVRVRQAFRLELLSAATAVPLEELKTPLDTV